MPSRTAVFTVHRTPPKGWPRSRDRRNAARSSSSSGSLTLASHSSGIATGQLDSLDTWPVDRPASWLALVNRPQPPAEAQQIQASLSRGRPLGDERWTEKTAERLGLNYTLNPRGRPPKTREVI